MPNQEKQSTLKGINKTEKNHQINLASHETPDGEFFPEYLNTRSDYEKNRQKSH